MPEFGDSIDSATFEQILEMDDDEEEREFSKSIVYDFFEQAKSTFVKMDSNLYVLTPIFEPSLPSSFPASLLATNQTSPHQSISWGIIIQLTSIHSEKKDLAQLSALGHFLKGSSATLGLTKVKDSCEKIQHFGAHKDETGTRDEPDEKTCLKNCESTIAAAKEEFREVEKMLRRFYHDE